MDSVEHRVLMNFMQWRKGWRVSFTEADYGTSLPRKLTYGDPSKICAFNERGEIAGFGVSPSCLPVH